MKCRRRFETYNTFNPRGLRTPKSDPTSSSFGVLSRAQQNAHRNRTEGAEAVVLRKRIGVFAAGGSYMMG